jgi:hypothetical protein
MVVGGGLGGGCGWGPMTLFVPSLARQLDNRSECGQSVRASIDDDGC